MSSDAPPKGKEPGSPLSAKKFAAALQKGITPYAVVGALHGGDVVMAELSAKLDKETSLDGKLRLLRKSLQGDSVPKKEGAVTKLNALLTNMAIPISIATEIWARAEACLKSPDAVVRKETLLLMVRCIELQKDDLAGQRTKMYYKIIRNYAINQEELTPDELVTLEDSLWLLIEGGKNVTEVADTLLDLLREWMIFCTAATTVHGFHDPRFGDSYENTFFLVKRVFCFSFNRFQDNDVTKFLKFICYLSQNLRSIDVMGQIIEIFETIPKYGGVIPVPAVRDTIAFTCIFTGSNFTKKFEDQLWGITRTQLKLDHMALTALECLQDITAEGRAEGTFSDGASPRRWQTFRIRGALIFLARCLKEQDDHKAHLTIPRALEAVDNAMNHDDLPIASAALNLLLEIFESEEMVAQVTYEDWEMIWNSLNFVLRDYSDLFRRLDSRTPDSASLKSSESSSSSHEDPRKVLPTQLERMVQIFQELVHSDRYLGSLRACLSFQMSLSKALPDVCDSFILFHYENYHYCMPTEPNWLEECQSILEDFVRDDTKSLETRTRAVQLLAEVISLILVLGGSHEVFFKRVVLPLLRVLRMERQLDLCMELIDIAVEIGDSDREHWAIEVCKVLNHCAAEINFPVVAPAERPRAVRGRDMETWSVSETISAQTGVSNKSVEAVLGMVELFVKSLDRDSPTVSQRLYADLVRLVQNLKINWSVREYALDVLLRLRADSFCYIYLDGPLEELDDETVAGGMHSEDAVDVDVAREVPSTPRSRPRSVRSRRDYEASIISEESSEDESTTNEEGSCSYVPRRNRLKSCEETVGEEEDDLSDKDPEQTEMGSKGSESKDSESKATESKETESMETELKETQSRRLSISKYVLPISQWLDAVIKLCEGETSEYLLRRLMKHFPNQFMNKTLFFDCNNVIIRFRELLALQVIHSRVPQLDHNLSSALLSELIMRRQKILTVLIGYHTMLLKTSKDELVRCFQINLGRQLNAAITTQCIHSLMVCCYELPKSTARNIFFVLRDLSKLITTPALSVHILEFLVGVGRIPQIHGSFTAEQFHTVFQVALKFLDHTKTESYRGSATTEDEGRNVQYITRLAYEALTVWFLAVKLENRRNHVSWIVRQLIANGHTGLDDHSLVFVDFLERFSFSDSPLKKYPPEVEVEGLSQYKKHWVVGRSIQTAQVVREDGLVQVTVRKPVHLARKRLM
jgi:Domain of unknown function (DUF3384)/Tuberin